MKKHILTLIAVLWAAVVVAQESQTEYNFLRLPVSAHAAALGGDNISITDDDEALIFNNPALLTSVSDKTISLHYMNYMSVLITAIELYSGIFSLRVLHYRMWDYSALPFSFCDGLICPWFFGIWYLLSAVGIFLTDYVSYYIFHEGTHPMYRKKKKGCAEGEFVIK